MEALIDLRLPELDPRLLYHPGHTWVRVEDAARVRVGLDPFAACIAGVPCSVVLPQPGTHVRRGHPCAWLDGPGGTLTVLAPLSGVLLEANPRLLPSPASIADDPLGEGWLFDLGPSDLQEELHRLQAAPAFERRVARDAALWRRKVVHHLRQQAPAIGATLADGGARVENLDQLLGPRRRHELAAFFLATGRSTR